MGPGRQAAEDWAKSPQTLGGPQPSRRGAEESQGQEKEGVHESLVAKITVAPKSALKQH